MVDIVLVFLPVIFFIVLALFLTLFVKVLRYHHLSMALLHVELAEQASRTAREYVDIAVALFDLDLVEAARGVEQEASYLETWAEDQVQLARQLRGLSYPIGAVRYMLSSRSSATADGASPAALPCH